MKTVLAAALILAATSGTGAAAQFARNDIVVGMSSDNNASASEFTTRVYDASSDSWSNGPGWTENFIQSVEFDNAGRISHNAQGNLLAVDFGNSYYGFTIYNLATNGTDSNATLWSMVEAQGGTRPGDENSSWRSERGGGLSVSPNNNYVAWANYDNGSLWVHNYDAGTAPGSGATAGASISGARETVLGDGNGNSGVETALKPFKTQGTAWLDDSTVVAFNAFGELITWDISGVAPGEENGTVEGFQPTEVANWVIANDEVLIDAQYTDVEYNPLIDADHIYAAANKSDYSAELYVYDYNTTSGTISLHTSLAVPDATNGDPREPREIAFDSEGNLFYSGYAGSGSDNLVMKFNGATNIGDWNETSIEVSYTDTQYSPYNGLDVAASLPQNLGDMNGDGLVDDLDVPLFVQALTNRAAYESAYPAINPDIVADFDGNGILDLGDVTGFSGAVSASATASGNSAAVPEPATLFPTVLGMVGLLFTRRRSAES